MARLCERPGCSDEGKVVFSFDAAARQVWLDLPAGDERSAGVLCVRHADAMLVPLGWTLDDRRDTVPRLFVLPARKPVPGMRAAEGSSTSLQAASGREPIGEGEQLTIEEMCTVADITAREDRDDDDTRALPWVPYDDTSDLDGVLDARGELLARAFRGTERRH